MKPLSRLLFSSSILVIFCRASSAWAAACCGGGFAAPSVISGDDRAQLSASYSLTEVTVDQVDSKGIWREWEHHQKVQTYKIEGAHLLNDRFQTGFALPVVQRTKLGKTYSGLGDMVGTLGYEYLPDWNYSPIRPKGIAYFQLTLPTGRSRAESQVGGMDSRGNGFLALGLGTLLSKTIHDFDALISIEGHRSISKTTPAKTDRLHPGYGANLSVGIGYNLKNLRLGSMATWTYEDPVRIEGNSHSRGSLERYTTANFSLSYLMNDDWSGMISYADQTLLGSPLNTSLGQTVAVQILRRWGR